MKKILILTIILFMAVCVAPNSFAICSQCPEIQKQIKKEIKLTKEQKKQIKAYTKDIKAKIKQADKQIAKNQRQIDKILKQDCPDIVKMMELKNKSAEIKANLMNEKKIYLGVVMDVYTPEEQETVKRILSENSGVALKMPCEFCGENPQLRLKCKDCKKKKK